MKVGGEEVAVIVRIIQSDLEMLVKQVVQLDLPPDLEVPQEVEVDPWLPGLEAVQDLDRVQDLDLSPDLDQDQDPGPGLIQDPDQG